MKNCVCYVFVAAFTLLAPQYVIASYNASGGYVTLLGSNSGVRGESTFMTNIVKSSYGWSDGRDPHSGTNYYCGSNVQLCTPKIEGEAFTFPGDSLVIGWRLIALATATVEVEDLRLEKGGYLMAMSNGKISLALRGSLTVMGDEANPSWFNLGESPQHFKVESSFKGNTLAYVYSDLAKIDVVKAFVSFATQYVELDDADEYYGTFEVRTNTCLKLASDMPGTVKVKAGGCLTTLAPAKIKALALEAGASFDVSGGLMNVTNSLVVNGPVKVLLPSSPAPMTAVLTIPADHDEIPIEAFAFPADVDKKKYSFSWNTKGDIRILYLINANSDVYNAATGYMTLAVNENMSASCPPYALYQAGHWSDATHVPGSTVTNYFVQSSRTIWIPYKEQTFAGESLTIAGIIRAMNSANMCVCTINDLRLLSGSSMTTSGGASPTPFAGTMHVFATADSPFLFTGGRTGQLYVIDMRLLGDSNSAIKMETPGNDTYAPGTQFAGVDLLGDCTGYYGHAIVGTNETLRLGNTGLSNGTVELRSQYSFLSTLATNGAEVAVGVLRSVATSTVIVPETNSLSVGSMEVTGTLTKNGGGVLASGGMVAAGAGAALSVAEGGLRADSAQAFNGIPIAFANGAAYVRDCGIADAELDQYGLYSETEVTAAGTLNVDIRNFTSTALEDEVALFTVPESCADALFAAICFSPRPKGYSAEKLVVAAESGMKTIKARITKKGMEIIIF